MVLAETTDGQTTYYLHGLDLVAESDGVSTEYVLDDGLGSVRQLANPTGSVLLAQTYDPYGNLYASAGTSQSHIGYAGEQTDGNGLVYLRARYYNPSQGRFLNMDPSRQEQNPYQYAAANPILHTDPSGLYYPGIDPHLPYRTGLEIIAEFKDRSAVEALAQLFVNPRLDVSEYMGVIGKSASRRLEFILRLTNSTYPVNAGIQLAIDFGELGFCDEFQDAIVYDALNWKWHDEEAGVKTNQIGHFLTAANLGYDPGFLRDPLLRLALGARAQEDVTTVAIKLIAGHELVADPLNTIQAVFGLGQGTSFAEQYGVVTDEHVNLFLAAVEADQSGPHRYNDEWFDRDDFLEVIFESAGYDPNDPTGIATGSLPWAQGNSMQDLRLSVKGYRFGQEIRNRTISTRPAAAEWLRRELIGQY